MTTGTVLTLVVIVGTSAATACYLLGLRRVWTHARNRRRHAIRALTLLAAVVVGLGVTMPPLGEELEQRMSSHMVQHVVLIMVVAPLLALAAPGQVLLAGMPASLRRRWVARVRRMPTLGLLTPHVAWALQIAALWAWHLPAAYDAALASESVHLLEHACFLLTAWLFWWHLATTARRRLRGPAAALYVAAAIPPGAALGAVLTFPDHTLYPLQAASAAASGIDPLFDQRVAGLVMWVPLDFVYLALAVWLFGRWLAVQPAGDRDVAKPLRRLPPDAVSPSPGASR